MVWKASDFDSTTHKLNGVDTPYTQAEKEKRAAQWNDAESKFAEDKLKRIRHMRDVNLQKTDFWVLRGNMTVEQSDWRQGLRDIPQNNTTEAEYDLILARDEQGNLTHAVWSKP